MGVRAFFLKMFNFLTRKRACLVYTDHLGNSYYSRVVRGKERRWVVYASKADPSTVPAGCHLWLHYTSDHIVADRSKSVHIPNFTGTNHAYHPHKTSPIKVS
ncbi:NADH-ubiquinone oxidoreductase subunit NDUFA12 family protein [Anaplasma phagocytophilum]|uniref:NADH dehydrogenase n=4 Tax=Anaplasma phagocytophilum TaxID=948 RepID=A0AA45ZH98_ANAPH|nr:NADH-ubiquinone oxidoreductase subunit NDUFA12 family protein [Anaplasma phagocytophilum]ABD44049.1 conserved domain protein [Anaplasma phagocytophilum str. HZ]KDB56436.1 NADH:ubiquinone oxidoreductase [Anaplasma phagocytophilum str. MRK]KDB57587.1 NADH:ubiquinone oxidoreductase [Anaplasma phagocytophilum str. CRT35]AGR78566.1 dehydrogenase [Anaplasma phagocytophilum str. HZ2]AGR79813.1 dehydrogenase [Anaplasma phagocytophilum str. JM]